MAWLFFDTMASKLAKAIYSKLSAGENLGGKRVVRGFDNLKRWNSRRKDYREKDPSSMHSVKDFHMSSMPASSASTRENERSNDVLAVDATMGDDGADDEGIVEPPNIKNVIFLVHG